MKVRNIVRKAATVGAGVIMTGATILGATAYDLGDFPDRYIVDGAFDGNIVIGEKASPRDLLGAVDIAASLQGSSVVEVAVPGGSGKKGLTGEGYELNTGSDQLELRENVGKVIDTISEYELPGLKSGTIITSEGSTDYFQYLRFKDGNNLQNFSVNYIADDDNNMDTFLVIETDLPFIEWELQLPEGLESDRDTTTGTLEDLEDKGFNILGQDFTIVRAEIDLDGTDFEMILMGGSVPDTLREGETKLYSIDGVDYEVTLVFVSDPNTGKAEAKLSVNGELTQALEEGETDTLSGGIQVGLRDLLTNAREGVASFFIGADKIEITDGNVNNTAFDGKIEINNENINDGELDVQGSFISTNKFEITDIKYRLVMDAESSTTAYIPPGHGVREFMDRPESLISESLDLFFAGLEDVVVEPIEIKSRGDDEYDLIFTNIQGRTYRVPLISNDGGVFKYGEDTDDFIFVEGASGADYVIGDNDYFIVSNDRGGFLGSDADKSVTNALRYEDYDNTDFTLEFEDLSTGSAVNVPVQTDGTGSLVIGGHTYTVNVSNRSAKTPTLAVDLNADGDWASDVVSVTTWGGVVLDVGAIVEINDTVNVSSAAGAALSAFVRNGVDLETTADHSGQQRVFMKSVVLAKNFDTSNAGDEVLNWTVNEVTSGDQIDLDVAKSGYVGPLEGVLPGEAGEFQFDEPNDDMDDWQYGITDWGIFVKEHDPDDSDQPNELTLEVPQHQRTAQVFVTLGSVGLTDIGGDTTQMVNPIAVGLAVLDSEAPAIGTENIISVGGPCANTVSAELLGFPENCAEGFEPGKAVIQAWDKGDTVATLVAGYEAKETIGASRVLAAYQDYPLSGSAVEVIAADLNSLKVNPISSFGAMDDGEIFADGFESGDTSAWSDTE